MASEKQEFAPPSQAGRTIHIQAALSKGHHSQIRLPITTPNRPELWRADLPGNRLFKSNHNKKIDPERSGRLDSLDNAITHHNRHLQLLHQVVADLDIGETF